MMTMALSSACLVRPLLRRRTIHPLLAELSRSPFSTESSSDTSEPSFKFPWRHTTDPLPRLDTYDDPILPRRSGILRAFFQVMQEFAFSGGMGVSLLECFFPKSYHEKLASDFAWAFQKAVASVVSSTFGVPISRIDTEEKGIQFDSSSTTTEEESQDDSVLGPLVLEESLRDLYRTVEDPTSLDVVFFMMPLNQRLLGTFVVPSLTRQAVQQNPQWKGAFQKNLDEVERKVPTDQRTPYAEEIYREIGRNGVATLIADVAIECLEAFQIRDRKTGEVLHGSESPDLIRVTHVVRFEMIVSRNEDGRRKRKRGPWRIVDWDELLEGNIWY